MHIFWVLWVLLLSCFAGFGCNARQTTLHAPAGSCFSCLYPFDPGSRTKLFFTANVGISGMTTAALKANIINFTRLPTTSCNHPDLAALKLALFDKNPGWSHRVKEGIFSCQPVLGMTREEALLALGNPLRKKQVTSSLNIIEELSMVREDVLLESGNVLQKNEIKISSLKNYEKWYYKKVKIDRSTCFMGVARMIDVVSSMSIRVFTCFQVGFLGGDFSTDVGRMYKLTLTFNKDQLVRINEDE